MTALLAEPLVPWLAVVGLGAYHGLNPGMGWLFAVALGLQRGSGRAVLAALPPIALGHAASLAAVALVLAALGALIPPGTLHLLTATALLAFGLHKLFRYYRHPRWVGMAVNRRDLVWWSFLMATAHGAGLMIAPVLVSFTTSAAAASQAVGHHAEHLPPAASAAPPLASWALALGLHTAVLLGTSTAVAWLIYRYVGLAILRRGWINFDLLWAAALIVAGALALLAAV